MTTFVLVCYNRVLQSGSKRDEHNSLDSIVILVSFTQRSISLNPLRMASSHTQQRFKDALHCTQTRLVYHTHRQQMQNFAEKRDGLKPMKDPSETCKLEEVCGDDFFGSVVGGLNGLSPPEKFEAAGVDPNRPNSTSFYD
eukprot:193052-Pyramimonas_sp.AAC.1